MSHLFRYSGAAFRGFFRGEGRSRGSGPHKKKVFISAKRKRKVPAAFTTLRREKALQPHKQNARRIVESNETAGAGGDGPMVQVGSVNIVLTVGLLGWQYLKKKGFNPRGTLTWNNNINISYPPT